MWKSRVVENKVKCHIKESVRIDLWNKRGIAILRNLQQSICGAKGVLQFQEIWENRFVEQKGIRHSEECEKVDLLNKGHLPF